MPLSRLKSSAASPSTAGVSPGDQESLNERRSHHAEPRQAQADLPGLDE